MGKQQGSGTASSRRTSSRRCTPPRRTRPPDVDAGEQTARPVARRCANELAVHRFDAQTASGSQTPFDAAHTVDIIDEVFVLVPAWGNPPNGSGKVLHVCGTDLGEWTITMTPAGLEVERQHGDDADLTVRGVVSDLALTLFQRPPMGEVEQRGEHERARRLVPRVPVRLMAEQLVELGFYGLAGHVDDPRTC